MSLLQSHLQWKPIEDKEDLFWIWVFFRIWVLWIKAIKTLKAIKAF